MFYERNLNNYIIELKNYIHAMRLYFYIPIVFLIVIIPIYVFTSCYIGYGLEFNYICDCFLTIMCKYCPAIGILWPIWVLQIHIENEGRELMYMDKKEKWSSLMPFLCIYYCFIFISVVTFLPFLGFTLAIYTYIWLCVITFGFYAITYMFSYLLKSVTLTIIPILMYVLFILEPINSYVYKYSYIRIIFPMEISGMVKCFIFFIVSFVLYWIGKKLNNRYSDYP